MAGLLDGNDAGWNNRVISEYTGEGVIAPCRMLRRDNYKYIYTHGYPPLLYDLDCDPGELRNLAGMSETAQIEAQLASEILTQWDPVAINDQCLRSQRERLFIQATTDGEPSWAFVSRAGDDRRYVRNASAVGTKAAARYPFVEPTPFKR